MCLFASWTPTEWLTLALVALTAVLVGATIFYAWATFKILGANQAVVSLMREEQRAQLRPYIQVAPYIGGGAGLLYLSIKNVGRTPARHLKLSLDKPVPVFGDPKPEADLGRLLPFTQPMESLAPGVELSMLLGIGRQLSDEEPLLNLVFTVTAEYDVDDKRVSEDTPIDLRPYKSSSIPRDAVASHLDHIRRSLDDITKAIGKVAQSNTEIMNALRSFRR